MKLEGIQRLHTAVSGSTIEGVYREASHPTHRTSSQDLHVYDLHAKIDGCMSFGQ